MVADDQIDSPVFGQTLLELVDDAARRDDMRAKARELAGNQAAGALADQVELVAQDR